MTLFTISVHRLRFIPLLPAMPANFTTVQLRGHKDEHLPIRRRLRDVRRRHWERSTVTKLHSARTKYEVDKTFPFDFEGALMLSAFTLIRSFFSHASFRTPTLFTRSGL